MKHLPGSWSGLPKNYKSSLLVLALVAFSLPLATLLANRPTETETQAQSYLDPYYDPPDYPPPTKSWTTDECDQQNTANVSLKWNDPEPENPLEVNYKYEVYRCQSAGCTPDQLITTLFDPTLVHRDYSVNQGQRYKYKIKNIRLYDDLYSWSNTTNTFVSTCDATDTKRPKPTKRK